MNKIMIATYFINSFLVTMAVIIHYEVIYRLAIYIPGLNIKNRFRVVIGIFGALIAHVIEIWLFAAGFYLMINFGNFGELEGNFENSLLDCVYFSFVTYTSLGLGDIAPKGEIRFLAGLEALTGLVMITWTASFLFIEMQKFWKPGNK